MGFQSGFYTFFSTFHFIFAHFSYNFHAQKPHFSDFHEKHLPLPIPKASFHLRIYFPYVTVKNSNYSELQEHNNIKFKRGLFMKHTYTGYIKAAYRLGTALLLSAVLLLTGCGGPSEEKIAKAQETYSKLVTIHNEVVSAHKQIEDASLDEKLTSLSEKLTQLNTYHLNEMTDEEIDMLIDTIESIIDTYEEYLAAIEDIKTSEDAAVLTPIDISLVNDTGITFTALSLYEKGIEEEVDILDTLENFSPSQQLTGLVIYRDTTDTPWILKLIAEDDTLYETELPVKDYPEEDCTLTLTFDEESQTIQVMQTE